MANRWMEKLFKREHTCAIRSMAKEERTGVAAEEIPEFFRGRCELEEATNARGRVKACVDDP